MHSYGNTFVRGPSPSYTDDATSENAMSATLPMESNLHMQSKVDNCIEKEFNCGYDGGSNSAIKKGRKTFAFWTMFIILLALTIGNLILMLTIFGVMHLGRGINGIEIIPEHDLVKFYGYTDLDRVYSKQTGQIDGFVDQPVTITADDGVYVRLHKNGQAFNRLTLDKSGIQFQSVNNFEVKDSTSGHTIFTSHRPHYNIPTGTGNLHARTVSASRIASPIDRSLNLEADLGVSFKGSEGISLDAGNILLQSLSYDMMVNSTEGLTILEAGAGIYLDMDKIPIVSSEFGLRTGSIQYKICVCMPKGKLFRIPVPRTRSGPKVTCAHFNVKYDPCA
ncbi:beta-sarcoglycan [Anastrepha ludens]|uniref:beta-sarcoglycan n=1 Tax=Anastrepha ludens TaxID=28586 RepID=UPI0023B01C19|nr:beta-sarcoglycan [Anastrepha ludens]